MALGENISHLFAGPQILNKSFSIGVADLPLLNPCYGMQGEDLLARSLLKDELGAGGGFYADIGAFEPCYGSNTYLFYQHGWRGVCVEPNPTIAQHYQRLRPDSIFINAAVGPDGPGYWAESKRHRASSKVGHAPHEFGPEFKDPIEVPFISLATVFATHAPAGRPIDYMSIDVEGFELQALQTNDWTRFRPKVIVIEENALQIDNPFASPALKYLRDLGYRIAGILPPNVVMTTL